MEEPELRDILHEMHVGVIVQDPLAGITMSNQAACKLLGLTESQLIGRTSYDPEWNVIHEDGSPFPGDKHPVPKAIRTGCPVRGVVMGVWRPSSQDHVWLQVDAEPVLTEKAQVSHVICTFSDITGRRRIEEALRGSEERYRVLFDSSPMPMWVYDTESLAFLAVNDAALQTYGYSHEEFLRMTIHDLHGDDAIEALLAYMQRPRTETSQAATWKHIKKDGAPIEVRITASAIRIAERNGRLAIIENVTERKQAERALRKLNRRLVNVLESIRDGFVTVDRQWNITYVNSRAQQMMESPRAELIGFNTWELFPEMVDTPLYKECHRAMAKQIPIEVEQQMSDRNAWWRIHGYPSQDGLSIYMTDITDRKRVEDELRQSIEGLRRSMDGIVRAMSFAVELRDPYTAGHQRRVSLLACAMARQMGMSEERIELYRVSALLHDIGKIALPAEILAKPVYLSKAEMTIVQTHAQIGYDLLKGIDFPKEIALVALQHHERLDGSGYPAGLSGDAIIPEARLMAVADVVEAMASHRPYRPALGIERALDEVLRHSGRLYDPEAVNACLAVFTENAFDFETFITEVDGRID